MPEDTKLYNFRLPITLMERVKTSALKYGLKITDIVLGTFQMVEIDETRLAPFKLAKAGNSLVGAFEAQTAVLTKERDEALAIAKRRTLETQAMEEEFRAVKGERDAALTRVAELQTELAGLRDARQPFLDEIAELKGRLASHRNPALAALRSDPAMKAIDPKVHHVSGPVLTDPVPRAVIGEAVGFNLKTKGKKS